MADTRNFVPFLYYVILCLGAPGTEQASDIYNMRKSELDPQQSTDTTENGNFNFVFRPIIGDTLSILKDISNPIGMTGMFLIDIAEELLPQSTGIDTDSSFISVEQFKAVINGIVPGTKWCGSGNIASSSKDLGLKRRTDYCCKIHDMCPINIPARSERYGLKNGGLFTRSSCDCEAEFYNCLKNQNEWFADKIGVTYFNILGPQCIEMVDCSLPW